jgi:hypothetical protein
MPEKKQSAWRFLWRSQDIRKKLLITLGILMIFRVAANVPVPGDCEVIAFFNHRGQGSGFDPLIPSKLRSSMGDTHITADHPAIADPDRSRVAAQDAGRST